MDPSANVSVPKTDPDGNVWAPLNANVPPKVPEPSIIKFSFMFTLVESGELMVVPLKASPAMVSLPVPLGVIFRSSFDLVSLMLLSSKVRAGNTTFPVPEGESTMSALDDSDVILFPLNFMSPTCAGRA